MGSAVMAVLRACLPAIGSDEQTQDDNGSLQGKGTVEIAGKGLGLEVEARGELAVESRWHAERKQWSGDMHVTRKGGDEKVKELAFDFLLLLNWQERPRRIHRAVQRALQPHVHRPVSSG